MKVLACGRGRGDWGATEREGRVGRGWGLGTFSGGCFHGSRSRPGGVEGRRHYAIKLGRKKTERRRMKDMKIIK